MSDNSAYPKVVENKELNLERIAWTTIGYGFVGSLTSYPAATVACGAIGCAAAIYDESKNKDLNLFTPAFAAAIGGFIGSFFSYDFNGSLPNFTTYAGIVTGGSLGIYNSFKKRKNKAIEIEEVEELDNEY